MYKQTKETTLKAHPKAEKLKMASFHEFSPSIYSVFSEAAGIAGNLCAFVLFVSPIPTFRRIIKNKSTEQFSGLPYVYSLLNCLICCWYGLPFVSPDVVLVATTNSFGAIFQFVYLAIFIVYADQTSKNLVIKSRSVEYMPFFLSFATFLMSLSFSAYGLLKGDVFIYAPNGIGTILGLVQLGLYYYYSSQFDESSREPLLQVYA
ncbi:Bidirectional sugar transporter SWEET2a [Linum perenne]